MVESLDTKEKTLMLFDIQAGDISSPQEGQMWYNSTLQKFRYFNGVIVRTL